jgi:Rrf2 family protein
MENIKMLINKTTSYALRAVIELAAAYGRGSLRAPDIARAQGIPPKYLDTILNILRRAGLVNARRGAAGGYRLARPPSAMTPRDVIYSMQGPVASVEPEGRNEAPGDGDDWMFGPMWVAVQKAVDAVCEDTTFAELVEERQRRRHGAVLDFVI